MGTIHNQSLCNALNVNIEELLEDGAKWAEEVGEAGEYFESSMRAEKLVILHLILNDPMTTSIKC